MTKDFFTLRTVRRKIILVSKIAGGVLIISYVLSTHLPVSPLLADWIWLGFVVLLVLGVDCLMGRFISDPVSNLNQAARQMAQLDFSSSCEIHTRDEFEELSQNLNRMSQNMQQTLLQLKVANHRLEREVEQERLLLAERKELVDRLSHEMKTPLGVIRAYAEGLQDEADEAKRQNYSEVIIGETERMSSLITTLLDLSALETGVERLFPQRFDFVEFLETIAGRLLIDSPDADFELQYELPEKAVYVNTDKDRMEQVLDNLILNAKQNVRPGGILKISLTEREGRLDFSVFDEGEPIPGESLPKIWTKFYRDKNSRYGGSGLGLAIVAQILSMQHLSYGVQNKEEGVEFYFSIPADNKPKTQYNL